MQTVDYKVGRTHGGASDAHDALAIVLGGAAVSDVERPDALPRPSVSDAQVVQVKEAVQRTLSLAIGTVQSIVGNMVSSVASGGAVPLVIGCLQDEAAAAEPVAEGAEEEACVPSPIPESVCAVFSGGAVWGF